MLDKTLIRCQMMKMKGSRNGLRSNTKTLTTDKMNNLSTNLMMSLSRSQFKWSLSNPSSFTPVDKARTKSLPQCIRLLDLIKWLKRSISKKSLVLK